MTPPDDAPVNSRAPGREPRRSPLTILAVAGLLAIASVLSWWGLTPSPIGTPLALAAQKADEDRPPAPDLDGGVAWINTAGPLKMADLKGKVVLLDFWTLCCINCIHVMPDLAKLEKKYPNQLVVIGVHSAKFDNEKDTQSIRKAVLRYELAHPVVNDAEHKIWNRYGVNSWPTLVLIDTEGKVVGAASGEGNYELLDKAIAKLIETGKAKKTLDEKPVRFDLVRYREKGDTPLFFPGKILADGPGKRLFIADSTHHRVVVTDLTGKKIAVIGTGSPGRKDGSFAAAQFDDPQGMALDGDTLYVADRKNHLIRALDLKAGTVSTVAGTGTQEQGGRTNDRPTTAATTGLNSPWDLLLVGKTLYIAMAGHHQIWAMDLTKKEIGPFAGDGRENIKDGPLFAARFAQPSGLATDGKSLYVADSEVSAVRRLPLVPNDSSRVDTLVGSGLFDFGDVDGNGAAAKLQHALGVAFHDGKLFVADTYNSKIKVIDPKTRECTTFLGGDAKAPLFDEPAGISYSDGKLYVADTNANRVRVVDLATKQVATLELQGVEPPPPQKEWQPPEAGKK
jgi:DNA-binding beta-propeller fold protein YncE